jgi:lipopolysaccharide export system protein LptC
MSVAQVVYADPFRGDLGRWRRRSRLVRTFRVLLPAAMAVIVAGVVGQVTWRTMTQADRKPVEAKTEIRLITPRFYGQSSDGRAFMIGAKSAIRDDKDLKRIVLDEPTLTLGIGSEAPTRVTAKSGVYREDDLGLLLNSDVRLDDGAGYRFASEQAKVDTWTGNITGPTSLQGDGPNGQVQSDAYSIYDKGDRVIFKGRVRARMERQ